MKHYRPTRRSAGFTLIELMISMTIVAFIALAVYQNTSQSFALREAVERDGDFYNSIRVVLDVLGRDISHVYTPQSSALPTSLAQVPQPQQNLNGGAGYATASLGNVLAFWGEPVNDKGLRPSRLQGEATKMSFVVNSHMRLFKDGAESDFAKISYSLEDDPLPLPGNLGKAFVKREDPDVFNERDHGDTEIKYVLLTNVKSIEFQYLDGEKDTLYSRWDTAEGLEHRGIFPAIIEVRLEVYTPASMIGGAAGSRSTSDAPTLKITERYRPELGLPVGGPPPAS